MKRMIMTCAALAGLVLSAALIGSAQTGDRGATAADETGLPDVVWKRGLAIAPVPLNIEPNHKKVVGEGSYIVNTTCIDCHSNPVFAPGGNPFFGQPEVINTANYLAGGAQFGPFTSANITPDASGRPAGLTFDQFKQVMRTGKDFKNRHPQFGPLLQVMPWPTFAKLTDDDIEAIYEYLRAIPHAEPAQ
jgi:mono/diheme cytochrome c family protein